MENFDQKIYGDVLVLKVNLTRAAASESAELKKLLNEQMITKNNIIADLSQCSHMDSTFIGVLVVTHKNLVSKGGELKLVEPQEPARELFHLTGVSKIFNTYLSAEEAVQSFTGGAAPKPKEKSDFEDKPRKKIEWDFN